MLNPGLHLSWNKGIALSLHYAEAQFQFKAKELALLVMCYLVISSEGMLKTPFRLNLSQILSWTNSLVSESYSAMFTYQLKLLMDYEQFKISGYLKYRVVAPLWYGTESCWLGVLLSYFWMEDFPVSSFPCFHSFLGKASHPEDLGLCPYLVKESRPTAF